MRLKISTVVGKKVSPMSSFGPLSIICQNFTDNRKSASNWTDNRNKQTAIPSWKDNNNVTGFFHLRVVLYIGLPNLKTNWETKFISKLE